jgi:chromosome segregation ATPase
MGDGMSDSDAHREQAREERDARTTKVEKIKTIVRRIDILNQEIADHDKLMNGKRTELRNLNDELEKLTTGYGR